MNRTFVTLLSLIFVVAPVWVVGDELKLPQLQLRVSLQPEQGVTGQQHRLRLEVLTSTWFRGAPKLPTLQLDGVVTLPPEGFANNFTVRENGQTFAGQAYEYLLFPQRSGLIRVPSLAVSVWSVSEEGQPLAAQTLYSEVLNFQVETVPGHSPTEPLLVAESVSMDEHYEPLPERLEPGDAVIRHVSIRAEGTPGMLIPPVAAGVEDGVELYQAVLNVSGKHHRGQLIGLRNEQLTYILPHSGDIELGELTLRWWSSQTNRLETLRLPARTITVHPTGNAEAEFSHDWLIIPILLLGGIIVWLVLDKRITIRRDRYQQQHAERKKRNLHLKLLKHCQNQEVLPLLVALYEWKDHYFYEEEFPEPLADIVKIMNNNCFGNTQPGNSKQREEIPFDRLYQLLKGLGVKKRNEKFKSVGLTVLYPRDSE